MKKRAYIKNQIQIIRKTKARFLSIFCIVFLGAAFFAGLRHTSSIMEITMGDYLKKYEYNDLNYISTLGFDESIVDKITKVDEVENVEYGNRFDALMDFEDSRKGVTVYTNNDFKNDVDKLELVEGSFPVKDDECVIDYNFTVRNPLKIGDKIVLSNDNGAKEFIVKGLVNDTRYFSTVERGTNTLGDGTNGAFIMILSNGNEEFALPKELYDLRGKIVFNELRVKLKNPDDYSVFSDDYLNYCNNLNRQIKKILNNEIELVNDGLITDANDELIQGEKEYADAKVKYEDGMSRYNEGLIQYQNGYSQYLKGKSEYDKGYDKCSQGLKQYHDGLAQYQAGLHQYLDGESQYNEGLSKWQEGFKQYQKLVNQYDQLSQIYSQKLDEYNRYLEAGVPESELIKLKEFLIETSGKMSILQTTYTNLKAELDSNKAILDEKGVVLNENKVLLENTKSKLDKSKIELDNSNVKLKSSKQQLNDTKIKLEESKKILDQTKIDLDDAKIQLNDARAKLDQGHDEIKDIPEGELITLTREENASIISYISTCDSMRALALVFPLIFFLVAALVSLTTMTRMVEEQRVQSGTFRALGYDKKDVINQYIFYAFLATFFASIIGTIAGVYFFPSIIYYLYHMMLFNVGAKINITFDIFICIQTFVISVAITILVTYIVISRELSETPASLLRPKPPKMGKRIVLEKITFIWKRLSFNQKVTMRNIFRYKKRFFMSIVGIAGCTALIVVGFGIKNSVSTLADKQYGEIWTYDGVVVFDKNLNQDDLLLQQNKFNDVKGITNSAGFYRQTVTVSGDKEHYTTLEVFDNDQELSKYIKLEDYKTHERLKLNDHGVIISAKLSELLGVKAGDEIKVKIDNNSYQVKVSGVMMLHFQHHIYMTKEFYHQLTGTEILDNYAYFDLTKNANEQVIRDYCNNNEKIDSINYITGISQGFRDQMGSIDSVVIILIACAGALAFIVLYNLTNINIQERKSEIATVKVLGFYPKEVYDYVFRENRILGVIGAVIGLAFGKILHMFIIRTVEVEIAMFVRSVNLLSYVYAFLITLFFTSLINFVMRKVLDKIDMVESLKSVE